jgi:hypothetical protein
MRKGREIVLLTPSRSRFCLQLLWIQRFLPCSPAKLMILKDRWGGVYLDCPFPNTANQADARLQVTLSAAKLSARVGAVQHEKQGGIWTLH